MNDKEKHWDESHDDDEYEKICYVCRRAESKAGKMISMPPGIDICHDCMQKAFDTMNQIGLDPNSLSGITPEMMWNAGMPMGMWQMPNKNNKPEVKKTDDTVSEKQKAAAASASVQETANAAEEEIVEGELVDEDLDEEEQNP